MSLMSKISDLIQHRQPDDDKPIDEEKGIDLKPPLNKPPSSKPSTNGPEPVVPTFPGPCSCPEPHLPVGTRTEQLANTERKIRVVVGTGLEARTYLIHRDLICHFSDYFAHALRTDRFLEGRTEEFLLPEDDPEGFGLLVDWLYSDDVCKVATSAIPKHVCSRKQRTAWCYAAPEMSFIVADRFLMPLYCRYTLSHFIQHIHTVDAERLKFIADNTSPGGSLYRFVRHWVAWRVFCQSSKEAAKKYPRQARKPRRHRKGHVYRKQKLDIKNNEELVEILNLKGQGWAATNPRKFELDHWAKQCGRELSSVCEHRVLSKQTKPPPKWTDSWWLQAPCMILFFLEPMAIIGLAAHIQATDTSGLIPLGVKVYTIIAAIFAQLCSAHAFVAVPAYFMALADAGLSIAYTKRCFDAVGDGSAAVCNFEAGLTGLIWVWILNVTFLIYVL